MLVSTVVAQKLDEELHDHSVRVVVSWGSEENTHVEDAQLIISQEHERGSISSFMSIVQSTIALSQASKVLSGQIGNLLVVDSTSGSHQKIATSVCLFDEALQVSGRDVGSGFSNTKSWLSELVISVRSEPDIVEGKLDQVLLLIDDSSIHGLSLSFKLVLSDGGVVDKPSQQSESLFNIVFVHSNVDGVSLLADLLLEVSSQSLDALLDRSSGVIAITPKS